MAEQARGASVHTQRTIPVVLYPGESEADDDSACTRWAHRARRSTSINALQASDSKVYVHLDRKLRYKFAMQKDKDLLYRTRYEKTVAGRTITVSTMQTVAGHLVLMSEPYIFTIIGGKRVGMQADPQRDA